MNLPRHLDFTDLQPLLLDCLKAGGEATFAVTGTSMFPFFMCRRDSVVLTACDPETLRVGDIPLYLRANGQAVLHRLAAVTENGFTMNGDGHKALESGVAKSAVVGVTTAVIRKGKRRKIGAARYRIYAFFWRHTRWCRRPLILFCWAVYGRASYRKWNKPQPKL